VGDSSTLGRHPFFVELLAYVKGVGGTESLVNPAVRQAYDAQAPEFELARELIAARTQVGLTQGEGDDASLRKTSKTLDRLLAAEGADLHRSSLTFGERLTKQG
jgi:hypothetical protein